MPSNYLSCDIAEMSVTVLEWEQSRQSNLRRLRCAKGDCRDNACQAIGSRDGLRQIHHDEHTDCRNLHGNLEEKKLPAVRRL